MKYYEFDINPNKIEFFNSFYGLERVLINGKAVSKKFSFLGTTHQIKMQMEDWELQSKYNLFATKDLELFLKKDGNLIEKQIVQIPKKHRRYWMCFGIFSGIIIYKFLNSLI
jgi:hypothetical protein